VSAAHVVNSYTVTGITATTPTDTAGSTASVVNNPFTGWDYVEGTGLLKQFVFTYLDETDADQSLLQADSTISVWTTMAIPNAEPANVNTAEFVLVGAVQMTVAATSAIALALLF